MSLGSGWQLIQEKNETADNGDSALIVAFANQNSKSSIALMLMDIKSQSDVTLDTFSKELQAASKGSDAIINSTTINGMEYITYSHAEQGVTSSGYITKKGTKFYLFNFINMQANNISTILNTVSIGGSETPAKPVTPATPPVEPVTPVAPVTPVTPPETTDPFTPPTEPVTPVEPVAPVAPSVKVDNDLLYLYNNNVYKNDTFKFYITLDENWGKRTYEDAHNFSFDTKDTHLEIISSGLVATENTMMLTSEFYKISPNSVLSEVTEQMKNKVANVTLTSNNFSAFKNTSLCGIPFKYFTYDTVSGNGVIFKSYTYVGIKGDSLYVFSVSNVNNYNKSIAAKALKGIVIQ